MSESGILVRVYGDYSILFNLCQITRRFEGCESIPKSWVTWYYLAGFHFFFLPSAPQVKVNLT